VSLSIIVKRVTGQTLDEVAREKIFGPLGMQASRFQHDHSALIANKAHGYESRAGAWHTSNSMLDVVGDGGMYSSVEDMLLWMKNFERPIVGAQALKLMQTVATLDNRQGTGYGMGLGSVQWRGLHTVGHSGSLAGYRTMFQTFPSEKTSIVVLCNSGAADASKLTAQVAEVFLSSRMDRPPDLSPTSPGPSPASGESPAIDPKPVGAAAWEKSSEGDLVGDYECRELRKTYSVAWIPAGLTIVADGFPARQLRSVADDRMRFADADIEIQFNRDRDQKLTGFSLSSNAGRVKNLRFWRL
jgi:hypothetical protein